MHCFSHKFYLGSLTTLFLLSLFSTLYLLINVNPTTAGGGIFTVFYLVIFLLALSGFTLTGYGLRALMARNSPLHLFAKISLRSGLNSPNSSSVWHLV